ncbi:GLPGLI family protein [Pedobacter ginsengisoli]|uniref:GLPGLI family protein n=1 Tax=Pedobacter ginsengisoli TaxID=363852 RepID=UPI002551681B|nr:GLPGLI family protein [Pedobacter ginsengisoli]
MKTIVLSVFLIGLSVQKMNAQQVFIPYGKITYEKKVNMQRSAADWNIPDEAKEKMKKYSTSEWELYFDQNKSLYKANRKEAENDNSMLFLSLDDSENQLYTNYSGQSRVIKKSVVGDDYLLRDTIPAINWKIMHDLRTIAGYECRKAIGRINDTVYVVAFYTEEILLKGGPEGFSGLPGMILGIAIPRFNTTWFATKIEGFANYTAQIVPPGKGKKTDSDKDLQRLLEIYRRYDGNKKEKPEDIKRRLFGFVL